MRECAVRGAADPHPHRIIERKGFARDDSNHYTSRSTGVVPCSAKESCRLQSVWTRPTSATIDRMTTTISPDAATARRQIDVAVGILIGLHGYSSDEAFDALAKHAVVRSVGLLPTARSVIDAAQGRGAIDLVTSPSNRTITAA